MTCDLLALEAGVDSAARRVGRRFGWHGLIDSDDLRQEGLLAGLETLARGGFDPSRATTHNPRLGSDALPGMGAYVSSAAARCMVVYATATTAAAPLRATRKEPTPPQARDHYAIQDTDDGAQAPLIDERTPETQALAQEQTYRLEDWQRLARGAIGRALSTLGPRERKAARLLWGLDGLAPERDCRRVARAAGLPLTKVYGLSKKLRRRFMASAELRQLHQASTEIREIETGEEIQ